MALRAAGLRANTPAWDGRSVIKGKGAGTPRHAAAVKLINFCVGYFENQWARWGEELHPPMVLTYGGHNRLVAGVALPQRANASPCLVVLDPGKDAVQKLSPS